MPLDQLAALLPPAGWWAVAGGLLLCLELVVPGVFLMWLGIAAGITALALLVVPLPTWAQLLLFAVLAPACVYGGWRWYRGGPLAGQGQLRDPSELMVGSAGTVADPIRHGHGKVRVNDSLWLAEGPDLDAGAAIRVTGQNGTVLKVVAD